VTTDKHLKRLKTPDHGICTSPSSIWCTASYIYAIRQYIVLVYIVSQVRPAAAAAAAADTKRRFPLVFIPDIKTLK